jgi:hypothetical protein
LTPQEPKFSKQKCYALVLSRAKDLKIEMLCFSPLKSQIVINLLVLTADS